MRLYYITLALLSLVAWLLPTPLQAAPKKLHTQFEIDKSLNKPKYVHGPFQIYTVVQPKKISKRVVPRTKAVKTETIRPSSYNACSCVSYARWHTGINVGPIGLAKNHPINSSVPSVGSLVITSEGKQTGHLAAVLEVGPDTITITEANYKRCEVGTRILKKTDPHIRGYYSRP